MKSNPGNSVRIFLLGAFLFGGIAALAPTAHASTYWNGPNTNFFDPGGSFDLIVPGVAIDRGVNGPLYNAAIETGPTNGSPADTLWAVGTPSMIGNLSASTIPSPTNFISFYSIRTNHVPSLGSYLLFGNGSNGPVTFVVHLINENIYLTLTFTAWSSLHLSNGSFAYTRSTASVGVPPTVSVTKPAPDSVFAAPANVTIGASASVSSGSVTNVSFFNSSSLLGSSQSAPFTITANGLGAGPYSLKAVATAAGVSATSSVVNVTVVTPVITSLSNAIATSNNQFVFSYDVNPGLSYVIEGSGDLQTFSPLATNVPASNPAFFTNPISGGQNFFRVGRMPNP